MSATIETAAGMSCAERYCHPSDPWRAGHVSLLRGPNATVRYRDGSKVTDRVGAFYPAGPDWVDAPPLTPSRVTTLFASSGLPVGARAYRRARARDDSARAARRAAGELEARLSWALDRASFPDDALAALRAEAFRARAVADLTLPEKRLWQGAAGALLAAAAFAAGTILAASLR